MEMIFVNNGAEFSKCRNYRYALWRKWDESKPMVMLVGLNPSTANENKSDATITKICKIVSNNGYGGFYMLNLFGFITAKPTVLKENFERAVGENNKYLSEYSSKVDDVVCCWGDFKEAKQRAIEVKRLLSNKNLYCLKVNKSGSPKHPLYCLDEQKLIDYNV